MEGAQKFKKFSKNKLFFQKNIFLKNNFFRENIFQKTRDLKKYFSQKFFQKTRKNHFFKNLQKSLFQKVFKPLRKYIFEIIFEFARKHRFYAVCIVHYSSERFPILNSQKATKTCMIATMRARVAYPWRVWGVRTTCARAKSACANLETRREKHERTPFLRKSNPGRGKWKTLEGSIFRIDKPLLLSSSIFGF